MKEYFIRFFATGLRNLMKYGFAIIFILPLQAQDFDITGGMLYSRDENQNFDLSFESSRISPLNDSMVIRTTYLFTNQQGFSYKSKINYELTAGMNFDLFSRFSLKGSLALHYNHFTRISSSSDELVLEFIKNDTIPILEPLDPPTLFASCDRYMNSSVDFGMAQDGDDISILNLSVRLNGIYSIIRNKVLISAGIGISTPIYSSVYREFISLDREDIDGEVVCSFVFVSDKNTSGDGFNNFKVELNSYVEYLPIPSIGVQIGGRRTLNNVFAHNVNPQLLTFGNRFSDYRPWGLFVGLSYKIGKKESKDQNIQN